MSDFDALLKARGVTENLGANITAGVFNRAGRHAAFALGDGNLCLSDGHGWSRMKAHVGAILALAADSTPNGFLSGGDDGKFQRIAIDGSPTEIAGFGMKWVENIASFAHPKSGLLACTVGKFVHLFQADGRKLRSLTHPSTVSGIAFDAKGKRIAAAHYNGASLWFTASTSETPRVFEWKGSHLGIAIHPLGEAIVTAMQENALHGWTLPEGKHMRMSGYPSKTESFGFTKSGKYLATGGADAIVLWPFFGGGPMGKPPLELGMSDGAFIKRIACHPEFEVVAAGFDDGSVIVADIMKDKILPVCGPGRGTITALAWNASGSHLALGTEGGFAALVDFSKQS
ncbi:MAG: WD40 repeat domain-containing protein [Acidocella sp.]|nr:WD40 repeat domain-containing protein [Acidocella sp.]